jgi:hypothetical protein
MFMGAGFIIASVAYMTSQSATHHSGLIAGLGAGSWSAAIAIVMPGIGRLFDSRSYNAVFAIATLLPIAGYVLWSLLNTSQQDLRTQAVS